MKPTFAQRLAQLMNERDVSQYTLGSAIGAARQTIAQYLEEKTKPSAEKLCALADFFGVPTDYLLGRADYRSMNATVQSICEETGLSSEAVDVLRDMKTDRAEKWENPYPYQQSAEWFPDWKKRKEGVYFLLNTLLDRDGLLEDLVLLAQYMEAAAKAAGDCYENPSPNELGLSASEVNEYRRYMLSKQAQKMGYRALHRLMESQSPQKLDIEGLDFMAGLETQGGEY